MLIITLLCQGAVARVHIIAELPATAAMAEMDCHSMAATPEPCHDSSQYCSGDCGQCDVISLAQIAIMPLLPDLPQFEAIPARHSDFSFTSVYLFPDSPPPSV
ncbi:hypothetical protein [Ferrimonas lipolytica]|uniref:Uncharacterized protein n=1 Tax=Ferrimonas lipolytica TaxID=2724191 RepID=A0A6H1UIB4_9GAMM|nr:hypothetical protein [Ferrimonas lipolytica]QIZ78369.1 hypothetical protein HER31_16555 [Ferrimonas lipolytica]